MDDADYNHLVLGLIFIKYISGTFSAHRDEFAQRLADKTDEYHLPNANPKTIAAELEERDCYTAANVF